MITTSINDQNSTITHKYVCPFTSCRLVFTSPNRDALNQFRTRHTDMHLDNRHQ